MVSIKNVGLLEIILLGRSLSPSFSNHCLQIGQALQSIGSSMRSSVDQLGMHANLAGTENVFIPLIPNIKDAIGWQPHSGESMLKNNR